MPRERNVPRYKLRRQAAAVQGLRLSLMQQRVAAATAAGQRLMLDLLRSTGSV